jgi:hypothetical protein
MIIETIGITSALSIITIGTISKRYVYDAREPTATELELEGELIELLNIPDVVNDQLDDGSVVTFIPGVRERGMNWMEYEHVRSIDIRVGHEVRFARFIRDQLKMRLLDETSQGLDGRVVAAATRSMMENMQLLPHIRPKILRLVLATWDHQTRSELEMARATVIGSVREWDNEATRPMRGWRKILRTWKVPTVNRVARSRGSRT